MDPDQAEASVVVLQEEMRRQIRARIDKLCETLDEKEREITRGKFDGSTSKQIKERLAAKQTYLTESGIDKRWRRKVLPQLRRLLHDFKEDADYGNDAPKAEPADE